MNKLYPIPPSLTVFPASLSGPEPARRLIVLVPDSEADAANVAHRVWRLATSMSMHVQLLGLCNDARQELSLRRTVAAMSAMVEVGSITAEAKVEMGANWVEFVKRNYQTGDMIVCFAEQHAGLLHRPLSQMLESKLNIPVYILSGLYPQKSGSNWLSQITTWSGSIGIIIGFFLLQVKIEQLPDDWFQTGLFIFSIVLELWLIWVWNRLFG